MPEVLSVDQMNARLAKPLPKVLSVDQMNRYVEALSPTAPAPEVLTVEQMEARITGTARAAAMDKKTANPIAKARTIILLISLLPAFDGVQQNLRCQHLR